MLTGSTKYVRVKTMLAKTSLLNIKLQGVFQRTTLVRRVIIQGSSPYTLRFVDWPRPHSRLALYRNRLSKMTKYGENSVLTQGLDVLNDLGYLKHVWRKTQHDGKKAFSKKVVAHLLSTMENGNLV